MGSLDQSLSRARTWGPTQKSVPMGGTPLECPLVVKLPHVISLHQSAPLIKSLNHVARYVRAHSSLISVAAQDGQLAPVHCVVLGADCCSLRHVKDSTPTADGP